MKLVVSRRAAAFALALLGLLAGCSRSLDSIKPAPNLPPTVTIVASTAEAGGGRAMEWRGTDADGRVDHYLVSVTGGDASTTAPERVTASSYRLARERAAGPQRPVRAGAVPNPTIFGVRAVDDRGAMSEPDRRAFFEDAPAPVVRITSPLPSPVTDFVVPSNLTIRWQAATVEGGARIESFRYLLLPSVQLPVMADAVWRNLDTLRALYAPDFEGWTEVKPHQTSVDCSGLIPYAQYIFAITVVDRTGAYDPLFDRSKNVLRFIVSPYPRGPRLTIRSSLYTQATVVQEFNKDPARAIPLELPDGASFDMSWDATPYPGSDARTRWALDPPQVDDDSTSEHDPVAGWSPWVVGTTTIGIGPFARHEADRDHFLYVEAMDDFGAQSQEIFRIHPVALPPPTRPLLIVDDTRYEPDRFTGVTLLRPVGRWPTAAELDTFLYARGGVPWRHYPAGTLSAPGLFAGYDFDTLGTLDETTWSDITLEKLARYRAVIWMVDAGGATLTEASSNGRRGVTLLRHHSMSGMTNPLGAYVAGGGRLWLLGGGAGYALMAPWNRGSPTTFTSPEVNPLEGELVPGLFMTDAVGWRSGWLATTAGQPLRVTGVGQVRAGTVPSPAFPALLQNKIASTDPLPPLREAGDFYLANDFLEELDHPNTVTAVIDVGRHEQAVASVLDSIYYRTVPGEPAGQIRPAMTRIRLPGGGEVLFSGFSAWHWRRQNCAALVDAVLQGEWGMTRSAGTLSARTIARGTAIGRADTDVGESNRRAAGILRR